MITSVFYELKKIGYKNEKDHIKGKKKYRIFNCFFGNFH